MNEQQAVIIPQQKRAVTTFERVLLPAALIIGILFDRLIANSMFESDWAVLIGAGVFWLCYLAGFYALYWERLKRDAALWFIAGCAAALCVWNFIYSGNGEFRLLTFLAVPCVLMAHAQMAAGQYALKDTGRIAAAWLLGWMAKPFTGLPALFESVGSLMAGGRRRTAKKVALGVLITLPLLCLIVPLLSGADLVFGYYLERLTASLELSSIIGHAFVIAIAFGLFYSFLWNVGFGTKEKPAERKGANIDAIAGTVVLCAVMAVYALFCGVRFTYLFSGAGLPDGMTYSSYAREGFAQTVAVCAINLLIFGVFLRYGSGRFLNAMLAGLLGLTGVMLVSGMMRLNLYIDAYGLTWLRLLSAWFVIYLAVVIVLCAVRMSRAKLPLIAVCALLLLGWYTVLGYANPDALAERYNQSNGYSFYLSPHAAE